MFNPRVDNTGGVRLYSTVKLNTALAHDSPPDDDRLTRVFSALADTTRRGIVVRLCDGDATLTELAEPYDISVQAISKHLRVLEDAGLVTRGKDAQRRPVHLEAEVFDLMTRWLERYRRQAEERYRRLDSVLAAMAGGTQDDAPHDPLPDRHPTSDPSPNGDDR